MFHPLKTHNNIPEHLVLSMSPEEVHGSKNRVRSRGLVLNVKPERFRLPFVGNTSVPVILENKNNCPISYSVDTSNPMSIFIDPKDGFIEPGEEAHVIIRRPSRISVTKREEHLVFQIKSCNGCNYDKDYSKQGRKIKDTDSFTQGESRSQPPKPYSDSRQQKFSTGRSIQGYSAHKGSRYYDEENSNCYDAQYAQTGSHFIDDYESNRGRHGKREFRGDPKRTPENFNGNSWNSNLIHSTGSNAVNNNHSNKNRSSRFFLTTGPEFVEDIDSNRSFQSKGVPYAPKRVKGDIDHTYVSTGQKFRDDNNSNWKNNQGSKFVDQSQRHISSCQNRGVPKTHKRDQYGDRNRSNYTLVSTGQKFRNDTESNWEKFRDPKFNEQNQIHKRAHINAKENFVNEDDSLHLYKGSDIHGGCSFSDRGDSNRAIRGSVGSDNEFKMDELGNGVDKRRSGSTRRDVQRKSKYDDSRADGVYSKKSLYPENQPDMSYHKSYPSCQYENYTENLYDDVKSVYGEDAELNNDKESMSFDREVRNKEQKGVEDRSVEKPRSDSMFTKLVRRMTSLVIPSLSKKPNGNGVDEKPLVNDEEHCCDCCCRSIQSREGTSLKIMIKNKKEAAAIVWNIPLLEKLTLTNKKVLFALLISLITIVSVLATCWQGTFVIPYYAPVKPTFWELLKE